MSFQIWQNKKSQTIAKEIRVKRLSRRRHTGELLLRSRTFPKDTRRCRLSCSFVISLPIVFSSSSMRTSETARTSMAFSSLTSIEAISALEAEEAMEEFWPPCWSALENLTQSLWPSSRRLRSTMVDWRLGRVWGSPEAIITSEDSFDEVLRRPRRKYVTKKLGWNNKMMYEFLCYRVLQGNYQFFLSFMECMRSRMHLESWS